MITHIKLEPCLGMFRLFRKVREKCSIENLTLNLPVLTCHFKSSLLYTHTNWCEIMMSLLNRYMSWSFQLSVWSFPSRWSHSDTQHLKDKNLLSWALSGLYWPCLVSVPCLYNRLALWKCPFTQTLYVKAFDGWLEKGTVR